MDNEEDIMEGYWAAQSDEELGTTAVGKFKEWRDRMESCGQLDIWRLQHRLYYEMQKGDQQQKIGLRKIGKQKEMTRFVQNHYRQLIRSKINLAAQNPSPYEVTATNTDSDSMRVVGLSKNILTHLDVDKGLESKNERTMETASVYGKGFMTIEWDQKLGMDIDSETGQSTALGDVDPNNILPFDVAYDTDATSWDRVNWVIVRDWQNRWDLAAVYDALEPVEGDDNPANRKAQKILDARVKSEYGEYEVDTNFFMSPNQQSDFIAVYKVFHKRSPAMPDGLEALVLEDGTVLRSGPIPYRQLPIERLVDEEYLGGVEGYAAANTIIPNQQMLNVLDQTIATNQRAFGITTLVTEEGSGLSWSSVGKGMKVLTVKKGFNLPQALGLPATSSEMFAQREKVYANMIQLMALNEYSQGIVAGANPTGSAFAMMASQAQQAQHSFQSQFEKFRGRVATQLLNLIKDFANEERIIAIAGKRNATKIKFIGSRDLKDFDRVTVKLGNPLLNTWEGRMTVADQMSQMGMITSPEQYFEIMDTGNLESINEVLREERVLIAEEDERLLAGEQIMVMPYENHAEHVRKHTSLLMQSHLKFADTDENIAIRKNIEEHINIHTGLMNRSQPMAGGDMAAGGAGGETATDVVDAGIVAPGSKAGAAAKAAGTDLPNMPVNPATGDRTSL